MNFLLHMHICYTNFLGDFLVQWSLYYHVFFVFFLLIKNARSIINRLKEGRWEEDLMEGKNKFQRVMVEVTNSNCLALIQDIELMDVVASGHVRGVGSDRMKSGGKLSLII